MSDAYSCVSADGHLEFPPDAWTHRVPEQYRDYAPRRIRLANGGDGFLVEGQSIYQGGSNLYAGRDPETYDPVGLTWNLPGTGGPEDRLREMDQDGVDAEVLFPGVGGRGMWRGIRDPDAYHAVVRGYNDYLGEEYCAVDRDRLIGLGVIPERGLDEAIAELKHIKALGLKAINLAVYPSGRSYPTPEDDRFWAATLDLEMPITIHVQIDRVGNEPAFKYPKEPPAAQRPPDPMARLYRYGLRGAQAATQLVMAGVFDRFPKLRVYFAENQIGWIPLFLEQMDHNYRRHHYWAERTFGWIKLDRLPSEYVREHCYWGFFNDRFGIRARHEIGVEHILWGGDFPHVESDWPCSQQLLKEHFEDQGIPADERQRIVAGNAVEFFRLGNPVRERRAESGHGAPATAGASG
jgi:predicted TIM-barrel fold metal-dependent hydrolase